MLNNLYIGTAGWSYPDWNGIVYPLKKERGFDPLRFLSSYFNLIEINSTFYRPPKPEVCRTWAERVNQNPDFGFTVKAYNGFTHSKDRIDPSAIQSFKRTLEPLQESQKLHSVLLQFPWSFKDVSQNRRRLETLISGFEPLPVCLEVRHGSWAREPGEAFLKSSGATVCCIDQPVIGDSITARTRVDGKAGAYFRFHGRNHSEWFKSSTNRDMRYNYLYSKNELSPFVKPIRDAAETARRVTVVMNNHFRGQAVANAAELKSTLLGRKVRVPAGLIKIYPRLAEVAEDEPDKPGQLGWLFDGEANGQK